MHYLSDLMEKINRPKKTESSSCAVSCHYFLIFKRKRILLTFKKSLAMWETKNVLCYRNLVLNIKSMLRKTQACLVLASLAIDSHPDVACEGLLGSAGETQPRAVRRGLAWGADRRGCGRGLAPLRPRVSPWVQSEERVWSVCIPLLVSHRLALQLKDLTLGS